MAFLREYPDSKYIYLRYRDLDTGIWRERSLKLVASSSQDQRAAQKIRDAQTRDEEKVMPQNSGNFGTWVDQYLLDHYENPASLKRAQYAWIPVAEFLRDNTLRHPAEMKAEHVDRYLRWRTSGVKGVKRNTARLEIKFLGFLMVEAIRRGYTHQNTIKTTIPKEEQELKAELTDDDMQNAQIAFSKLSKWMSITFEILINTGCRFAETRFHESDFDYEKLTIRMTDSKRKLREKRRHYNIAITQTFADYLKGIQWTDGWTVPPLSSSMNQNFNTVLKKTCGTTSHSCRVTFITRCHRANVSQSMVMKMVNHATKMIHEIYTRLNLDDTRSAIDLIKPPPPPIAVKK